MNEIPIEYIIDSKASPKSYSRPSKSLPKALVRPSLSHTRRDIFKAPVGVSVKTPLAPFRVEVFEKEAAITFVERDRHCAALFTFFYITIFASKDS